MVAIKSLVIPFFFLVQGIHSYCIYNSLTDGSSFEIYQAHARVPLGRIFGKRVEPDGRECCPYTTRDCSYRSVNADPADFDVYFHWPKYKSLKYLLQCTTGGGLTIYGTEQDHYAECTEADGNVKRVLIIPNAETS